MSCAAKGNATHGNLLVKPFNPLDYPVVAQPQTFAEATVGGLGIHLIRNYAQECRYERRGQKNWFTIVLNGTED